MSTLLSRRHRIRPAALLRLFLGILLPLLVVGLVTEDLLEGQSFVWETPFLLGLHSHATPLLDRLALLFTTIGGVTVIAPLSAVILAVLWFRGHRLAVFWGLGVAGAAGLNVVMKLLLHRTRPELWPRLVPESDASFPSGHSMYSAAFVTALILLAWRTPHRSLAGPGAGRGLYWAGGLLTAVPGTALSDRRAVWLADRRRVGAGRVRCPAPVRGKERGLCGS